MWPPHVGHTEIWSAFSMLPKHVRHIAQWPHGAMVAVAWRSLQLMQVPASRQGQAGMRCKRSWAKGEEMTAKHFKYTVSKAGVGAL
jgi:hypothetical protein